MGDDYADSMEYKVEEVILTSKRTQILYQVSDSHVFIILNSSNVLIVEEPGYYYISKSIDTLQ